MSPDHHKAGHHILTAAIFDNSELLGEFACRKNWTCCENAVQNSFDTAIAGRYPPNRRHDDANI